MKKRFLPHIAVASVALALAACGGSDSGSTGTLAAGNGLLGVSLTDAPACGYAEVNVTVTGLRFHRTDTAEDGDGGWHELTLESPLPIDLLDLTNGRLQALGDIELPAGTYNQARLMLAENSGNSLANSIVLTGETQARSLRTPSAQQSGSKINLGGVEVSDGDRTELVVDFDACRSIVRAGNSGNYNLKPKLTGMMVALEAPAQITGSLGAIGEEATVSAQVRDGNGNPQIVKSDASDPLTGEFVLSPLDESIETVDLVIRIPGKPLFIVTGVPARNADLSGLAAALSNVSPVSGETPEEASTDISGPITIPEGVDPFEMEVTAAQTVNGNPYVLGSTVVLAGDTESYTLTLPTQATRVAPYAAGSIIFELQPTTPIYLVVPFAEGYVSTPAGHQVDGAGELTTPGGPYGFELEAVIAE